MSAAVYLMTYRLYAVIIVNSKIFIGYVHHSARPRKIVTYEVH